MIAAGDGTADVDKRGLFRLNEVRQQGRSACPARWQEARDRQRDRVGGKLRLALGRGAAVIGEHDVRIGATKAKTGYASDLAAGVFGPLARVLDYFQALGFEIDITVRRRVIDIRRNHIIAHGLDDLDKAHHARSGFGVADIGFGRSQQNRRIRATTGAEHPPQSGSFDRITQDGAGAVGLDIVHVLRIHARIGISSAENILLCLRIRGGQAIGVPIGVDGRAFNDSQDIVAVRLRVLQTLEDEDTSGIGAHDAIGVVRKSVNGTRRRGNAQFRKRRRRVGSGEDIYATGQRHVRASRAQVLHRLIDGYEGGGAGRIHIDGRAAEIQGIGNAIGHHSRRNTGQRIRMHLGRIGGDEHAIVIIGRAHVHTSLRAAQLVGRNTSVF